MVQDLHEQVDGLQVGQLVVSDVHAQAEVEARIPPVDDLVGLELRIRQQTPLKQAVLQQQTNTKERTLLLVATEEAKPWPKTAHLYEIGEFGVPCSYQAVHLIFQIAFLPIIKRHIVLCKSRLAGTILKQDKSDHSLTPIVQAAHVEVS